MPATKRAPTTRQLIAAKQQAVAPKPVADIPADNRDSVDRYLDEIAPSGIVGRLLKFKDGKFVTNDDEQELPKDATFAALCDQTLVGWMKFNGKDEPPTRVMGLLFNGFVRPPRKSLGDLDTAAWEVGLDGLPADPWQDHQHLVLQNIQTLEMYTFDAYRPTGHRAVADLLRNYKHMRRVHPGSVPIVWLRTGGFQHRDPRVGWVNKPMFVVCGHRPADSFAKPDTSTAGILDDDIPDLLK